MKQEYITYTPEQLMDVDSFIAAYLHRDEQFLQAWQNWEAAHPECSPQVEEARSLLRHLAVHEYRVSRQQRDKLWSNIQANLQTKPVAKRRIIPTRWYAVAAASLFIAASLLLWLQVSGQSSITSMAGTHLTHVLPDESQIILNAASQITYRKKQYRNKRDIHLDGEAFFEVTKGAPFIVETDLGSIRVWGTSFNVFARDSIFDVKCYTGKVEVRIPGEDAVMLTPGQQYGYVSGRTAASHTFDPVRAEDWRSGQIKVNDQPLRNVFAEIERQYDVTIQFGESTGAKRYTGFYQLNQLDSALYHICWPMQLEFQINGKQITVK